MKPREVEYDLGKDVHGRTVLLIFEASGHGNPSWTIKSLGVNQRDEGWVVMGLTRENLLAMADAVKDLHAADSDGQLLRSGNHRFGGDSSSD